MSQLRNFFEVVVGKGFKTQALGAEYKDEDKKFGWRAGAVKSRNDYASEEAYQEYLRNREALQESDGRVTKYFNEKERQDSEVHFDEQGRAVGKTVTNSDGTVSGPEGAMRGKVEYVMDDKGTMHQFQQKIVETGDSMVSPVTGRSFRKGVATHHSSVMGGEAVAAAGEMELNYQGYLQKINNKSGHYKPGAAQVIQMLEELARQGALLDKNYMMPGPDGKGTPLEGKPKQIFEAVAKVEAGLKKKLAEGKDIEPDLAAIKKARNTLAKLGAAPANKFRPVEVEFIDGAENKKGLEIRRAAGATSMAQQFLQTGGGNQEQAAAKGLVLKDLKETLAGKARALDAQAEKLPRELRAAIDGYQAQLREALKDHSEKGNHRVRILAGGIGRIEKALASPDHCEEALDQILKELEKQLNNDHNRAGQAVPGPGALPPVDDHGAQPAQGNQYSKFDDVGLLSQGEHYSDVDDADLRSQGKHYSDVADVDLPNQGTHYSDLDDADLPSQATHYANVDDAGLPEKKPK